jgi:peptide/nickel transport system permease protein
MWRFALRESGRFVLGLFGALLLAAAISALADAGSGAGGFAVLTAERLLDFVRLDFGTGAISGTAAAQELAARAPVTLTLLSLGALIAILFGVPLGLLLGTGPLRRAAAPVIQIVSSAPVFVAGLALAFGAKHVLGWPPSDGAFPQASALLHGDAGAFRTALLPALTVGFAAMAAIQVVLRRAAAEVQDAPFRAGLRRLGLSTAEIDRAYVAPLLFSGLLANLGEVMLALLSAAVVAEWVFKTPGMADLFVKSVALHDWNLVALILFFFASAALIVTFIGRLAARAVTEAGRAA